MAHLSQRLRADVGFYIVVIVVAILAWTFEGYMNRRDLQQLESQGGLGPDAVTQLDSVQAKELDAFLDLNQQVTTLGTALLGGVCYLLFNSSKGSVWKKRKSAVAGALLISVSIFFGFVSYSYLIGRLQDGNPDPTVGATRLAQQVHFYTFLLGVVFFANFMFHNLPKEETE